MTVYAPKYYSRFSCIKGECRHSCCRAWEIGVDGDTLARIEGKADALLLELKKSISQSDGEAFIERGSGGDCPFLDDCGLCRIISAYGDEYLPDICREHPRFYNNLGSRLNVGLGLACEEAARIVLTTDDFYPFISVEEYEDGEDAPPYGASICEQLLAELHDSDYGTFAKRLGEKYLSGEPSDVMSELIPVFSELEYLNPDEGELIISAISSDLRCDEKYMKRFLAYMLYRYSSVAESEFELSSRITLSLVLTECFGALSAELGDDTASVVEGARILSSELEYSTDNIDSLLMEIDFILA